MEVARIVEEAKLFLREEPGSHFVDCWGMAKPTVFSVGDRVRLSELGRSRSPNMTATGVVVSTSRTGTMYMVLLDGRARPVQLHWTYLDLEIPLDRACPP